MQIVPTIPNKRHIVPQVTVQRPNGEWEDLTNYTSRIAGELGDVSKIGTGNRGGDSVVRQATLKFQNDSENSLHPLVKDSSWNQQEGSWVPLLWSMRGVVIRVAITELGVDSFTQEMGTTQKVDVYLGTGDGTEETFSIPRKPLLENSETVYVDGVETASYSIDYAEGELTTSENGEITIDFAWYYPLFAGYLGDSIKSSDDGTSITCKARDYSKEMQNAYISDTCTYGSDEEDRPLEDEIQQVLDDHMDDPPTLYVPEETQAVLTKTEIEFKSVFDVTQEFASKIGWYLGWCWIDSLQEWRYTLKEPPRGKDSESADFDITTQNDVLVTQLELQDRDIRNDITIVYRDDEGEVKEVRLEDSDSIYDFGRRKMLIREPATSEIDTEEEAERFGNAALHDLKDYSATNKITMPLIPQVQLYDGLNLTYPRLSSEEGFYGVESVRFTMEPREDDKSIITTEVVTSGSVKGSHVKWLRMDTRPGSPGKRRDESEFYKGNPPLAPSNVVAGGTTYGILLTFNEPEMSKVHWAESKVYVSGDPDIDVSDPDTYDFVSTAKSTRFHMTENVDLDQRYYMVVTHVDIANRESEASIEVDAVAGEDEREINPVEFDQIYWGADFIKITWNPHPDPYFEEYEVRLDDDFGSEDEI